MMRHLFATAAAVFVMFVMTTPVSAQTAQGGTSGQTQTPSGDSKVVHNTTAALGMGLTVIGVGIGLGMIGFAALNGIARQPEQAGAIQGAMFIIAGLVEGAGIISLVLCLVTIFV